jgi:hypothetical protein
MEAWIIQLVQAVGVIGVLSLYFATYMRDKGKTENKTENAVSDIAVTSTREISDVYKRIGDVQQNLGRAEGQNIILMDNLRALEQKYEAAAVITKDKIYVLQEKVEKQTVTISRHEGRIIELEKESKQKDAVIASKESEITELKIDNARQKVIIETHETTISGLNRKLELVTRTQTLDDTIQLTEADLADLEDKPSTAIPIEAPNKTTEETNDEQRKTA